MQPSQCFELYNALGLYRLRHQRAILAGPVDILVATPDRLIKHLRAGNVFLGDVSNLALDEVDTMFDEGFGHDVRQVLQPLRMKQKPARYASLLPR